NGLPSRWQSSAATPSSAFCLALAAPQTLQPHPFNTPSTGHQRDGLLTDQAAKRIKEKKIPSWMISVRKLTYSL
ncbi:hypothetical protein M441DRAFT_126437, partial [Trichoderma asperellum CBS 433.97]